MKANRWLLIFLFTSSLAAQTRPRARDIGIVVGTLPTGALNAITTNDGMSPLFQAAIDATEEAIYNSLLRAETVRGYRGVVRALPIDSTVTILEQHGAIRP